MAAKNIPRALSQYTEICRFLPNDDPDPVPTAPRLHVYCGMSASFLVNEAKSRYLQASLCHRKDNRSCPGLKSLS